MENAADPVASLFASARAAGVTMARICDRAGVARSTPSRWRNSRNGANLSTVRELREALTAIITDEAEAA